MASLIACQTPDAAHRPKKLHPQVIPNCGMVHALLECGLSKPFSGLLTAGIRGCFQGGKNQLRIMRQKPLLIRLDFARP
jgi:hypothetical protein